jgi:hypothetical protein
MLKFEIRSIIVDEEILGEVHLELVYNIRMGMRGSLRALHDIEPCGVL